MTLLFISSVCLRWNGTADRKAGKLKSRSLVSYYSEIVDDRCVVMELPRDLFKSAKR